MKSTINGTICPYCSKETPKGKRSGYDVLECVPCNAHVRIHRSGNAMGSLANLETRRMRYFLHLRINKYWETQVERTEFYKWISDRLKISNPHIGNMHPPLMKRLNEILDWAEQNNKLKIKKQ